MFNTFIGIDPGFYGAIAIIQDGKVEVIDMPLTIFERKNHLNYYQLSKVLSAYKSDNTFVCLEQVWGQPDNSPDRAFKFGMNYGICLGVIGSLGLRHQVVPAVRWKAEYHLLRKPKNASIKVARTLYSNTNLKHDGQSDALLLADYGKMLKSSE